MEWEIPGSPLPGKSMGLPVNIFGSGLGVCKFLAAVKAVIAGKGEAHRDR